MSWAGIANNQTVSLDNLKDAVANGVFTQLTIIPTGTKEITKLESQTYVCLDTTYAPFAAKSNNQLVVKSNLVPCPTTTTTSTTTSTTTAAPTTTTSTTSTTTAAPTTTSTTSTTTAAPTTSTTTTSTTLAGQTTTTTTTSTTTAAPTTTTTTSTTTAAPTTSTTTSTTTIAGETTTTTTTSTTTSAPTTTTTSTTTSTTALACECHDGTILDNNSFSYYNCSGLLITGGGEQGSVICFDINRAFTANIQDDGVSATCDCITTTTSTTTTSTTLVPLPCTATLTFTGGAAYPDSRTVDLGFASGTVTVNWSTPSQPVRVLVEWNPFFIIQPILDTQYRGSADYDYGGIDRGSFTSSLTGLADPVTGSIYPYFSVGNAPDGYPYVLSPNIGSQTWFKGATNPRLSILYVYAPIAGTRWTVSMSCPL